jgi:hypothetical protein
VLVRDIPDLMLVFGNTNFTQAGALAGCQAAYPGCACGSGICVYSTVSCLRAQPHRYRSCL